MLGLNYQIWYQTRNQEHEIENATDRLIESNKSLHQKISTHLNFGEYLDNPLYRFKSKDEAKKILAEFEEEQQNNLDGVKRYEIQREIEQQLSEHYFKSTIKHMFPPKPIPKVHQDSLHIGFTEFIIHDCKYELKINGEVFEYGYGDQYTFPAKGPIKIEMTQIKIAENEMSLDSVRAIRIINEP